MSRLALNNRLRGIVMKIVRNTAVSLAQERFLKKKSNVLFGGKCFPSKMPAGNDAALGLNTVQLVML